MISPADMPLRKVVRVQRTSSITGTQRNTLYLECGHVENIPRRQKPPSKRRCVACVVERNEATAGAKP